MQSQPASPNPWQDAFRQMAFHAPLLVFGDLLEHFALMRGLNKPPGELTDTQLSEAIRVTKIRELVLELTIGRYRELPERPGPAE